MSLTITLYGIKSCDTVRKARRFLEQQNISYQFHDWRSDGVDSSLLQQAADSLGWESLVNKRSTTWRQLDENQRATAPASLLPEHPTLIKRPLLAISAHSAQEPQFVLGFKAEQWQSLAGQESGA